MIELILYGLACWGVGWWAHSLINTNYRQRWKTATELLETTPEMREHMLAEKRQHLEIEQQARAAREAERKTIKEREIQILLDMTPEDRMKVEKERLFHGYEPIDPLTNLPSKIITKMMKERYFHGYDTSEDE